MSGYRRRSFDKLATLLDVRVVQGSFFMADSAVDEYLERLPHAKEIRERIRENLREREQLRRLLKVAEKERDVKGAAS